MLKQLVLAVLFVACLCGRPYVSEQQKGSADTASNKPILSQQPVPPMHVVIDPPLPASNSQPPVIAEREAPWKWYKKPEWVNVVITGAYVIIALFTLVAIGFQAFLMKKQSNVLSDTLTEIHAQAGHMKEQVALMESQTSTLEKSVAAAEQSANAALDQIAMLKSKERARLQLKPVVPTRLEIDIPLQDSIFEVENVGYSHAFNVKFLARCEITMSRVEPQTDADELSTIGIVRVGGKPARAGITLSATDEMWNNVIHPGATNLYMHLWGTLRYQDVFGDDHQTRFQYVLKIHSLKEIEKTDDGLDVIPLSAVSGIVGWRKCAHPEHNQVD